MPHPDNLCCSVCVATLFFFPLADEGSLEVAVEILNTFFFLGGAEPGTWFLQPYQIKEIPMILFKIARLIWFLLRRVVRLRVPFKVPFPSGGLIEVWTLVQQLMHRTVYVPSTRPPSDTVLHIDCSVQALLA